MPISSYSTHVDKGAVPWWSSHGFRLGKSTFGLIKKGMSLYVMDVNVRPPYMMNGVCINLDSFINDASIS